MPAEPARTAMVTGASGFVGSRLCRRLVTDGWNVHLVLRPDSETRQIAALADRPTIHRHDGSTEQLLATMQLVRPTVVFHLASLFLAQHAVKDVTPLVQSNVLFGAQLLEAMAGAGVKRLVNAGTAWQHYEGRDYSPVCLYAATKQAFEAIVQYYVEATGLRAQTLVLTDTYGPGDPRRKLFWLLRQAARSGERVPFSGGEQLVDLVHIDDVNDAMVTAATRTSDPSLPGHQAHAVSSGAPIRLRELVARIERQLGRPLPIDWGARPYRLREVMVPWAGPALPGWSPRVDLDAGLHQVMSEAS